MENNDYIRTVPKVSIVMPVYFNREQHGKYGEHESFWFANKCLQRLMMETPRELYELIIIDNGSNLLTSDLIESFESGKYAGIKECVYKENRIMIDGTVEDYFGAADILVTNYRNLGFAPACNQGFQLTRGEYVLCINNDILVWSSWLETMIKDYETCKKLKPEVGALMPALMRETRDAREAIAMGKIDITSNRDKFGAGAEFGSLWMTKTATLKLLKSMDGYVFDENFKVGFGEDRDLWKRMRKIGLETYRTHNTRVFHQGNMTMGKIENRKDYTIPNREYLAKKWDNN